MAYIKALSYYLPDKVVTNQDIVSDFPEWDAEKVANKVGVERRHIANQNETATDLGEKAALKLFKEHNISPKEIGFVLLCTQSPDYHLPSSACILQHRLGIPTKSGALDFNLGCSGAIYGMALAKGLIDTGIANNVLLITAETYNKYLHPSDKSNRSIFGDGAAACLISNDGFAEIGEFELGTDGKGFDKLIVKTGGARQKAQTGICSVDEDGHNCQDDFLYMNGSAIFNFTLDVVPPLIDDVIAKNGLTKDDIDYHLFHQANKFMLNTIRKICGIPKESFYINLEETGNTVSSTILIGLRDCIDNDIIKKGMNVMCCGFGVGLSWSGVILKF